MAVMHETVKERADDDHISEKSSPGDFVVRPSSSNACSDGYRFSRTTF